MLHLAGLEVVPVLLAVAGHFPLLSRAPNLSEGPACSILLIARALLDRLSPWHTDKTRAVGVDIGGTGIKAAIVDLQKGTLLSDRIKVATPAGRRAEGRARRGPGGARRSSECDDDAIPLGVAFPAIVKSGRTLSAANVSKQWIGFEAEKFFEDGLGRDIHFANDADVAGVAEMRYGAAHGAGRPRRSSPPSAPASAQR